MYSFYPILFVYCVGSVAVSFRGILFLPKHLKSKGAKLKTRIIFCLLLVVLFGFSGNLFAMEETQERTDVVGGPSEIDTPQKYEEIIGPQGTEGTTNTFYGLSAGSNTTGTSNSFFGQDAGSSNTTGFSNSFFGGISGSSNTTGTSNSFFGYNSGSSNTTGIFNSFFGRSSGSSNTTGNYNSFFGWGAGASNVSGSRNVFLGYDAGYNETGSNKLYIDNSNTSTPLIWGDFSTNDVIIYGGFRSIASYSSSDIRWKKDIQPLQSSLEKVSSLQGVTYEWKMDEFPNLGLTKGRQIGLIAQDVEKELPELVSQDKDGYKAVSYTKLTAVLVEAVKELKTQNQAQKEALKKQQAEIEELRSMLKGLKS